MNIDETIPRPVLLSQYRPPLFGVEEVELEVDLFDDCALVRSRLRFRRNQVEPGDNESRLEAPAPATSSPATQGRRRQALLLDGEDLELLEIELDGEKLPPHRYEVTSGNNSGERGSLSVFDPPDSFTLQTLSRIHPEKNTALEGLYISGGIFCTQCEPEGFRRITWYPDRPDVSAAFTVKISAGKKRFPVLLAGGNPVGGGDLPQGRHWASFHDPFPKPSYLFALVAGDLAGIHDRFTTASGREVSLAIYVERHNRDRCDHAMAALKKAMLWDEQTFGLEYDLDHYLIVAVDDFNMGAMENKGLNIFNARYVLARPDTATDDDFEAIESVIAHEYFHNWTGNRVTCRDWFQLSLKEGLTVFRDQLFSQHLHSPGVKRINDVRLLREHQFAEDAGPLAHPVRPRSYLEINNFYTLTVYEKGAEVVRMLHTLLGSEKFAQGLRDYLAAHDGGAATIEDFLGAISRAGGRDLTGFARWYDRAGTPRLEVEGRYHGGVGEYRLVLKQLPPPLVAERERFEEEGTERRPVAGEYPLIPVAVGLLDSAGCQLSAGVLELEGESGEFIFRDISSPPVPSLLRGFSAPVILQYDYSVEELSLLLTFDSDPFCRWEAGQRLAGRLLLDLVQDRLKGDELQLSSGYLDIYRRLLSGAAAMDDRSFAALLLDLPSEEYLAQQMEVVEVEAIHAAREFVRRELALALASDFRKIYHAMESRLTRGDGASAMGVAPGVEAADGGGFSYDPYRAGCRRLKNMALSFLLAGGDDDDSLLARRQFELADNMSDSMAALKGLVHAAACGAVSPRLAGEVVDDFARRWGSDTLVMDKWFAVQATAPAESTLDRVRELLAHPAFRMGNPNRVRALVGSFAAGNPLAFHRKDGGGYAFLAEMILQLDPRNPQIAARLASRFSRWRRYDKIRQGLIKEQLEAIVEKRDISRDLFEVVSKSL